MQSLWFFCSQLFCDFGNEFEVLDRDGENPVSAMVQKISKVIQSVSNFVLLLRALTTKNGLTGTSFLEYFYQLINVN